MAGTYTKLFYHLVFSTKHRQPFINASLEPELHKYIAGAVRGIGGICVEINGMPDHLPRISQMTSPVLACDLRYTLEKQGCSANSCHDVRGTQWVTAKTRICVSVLTAV